MDGFSSVMEKNEGRNSWRKTETNDRKQTFISNRNCFSATFYREKEEFRFIALLNIPRCESTVAFLNQANKYTLKTCILNTEPKALTGEKSEGIKSRGAAEAFSEDLFPVKAEGEEFNVLILSYTRELTRPFKENKG